MRRSMPTSPSALQIFQNISIMRVLPRRRRGTQSALDAGVALLVMRRPPCNVLVMRVMRPRARCNVCYAAAGAARSRRRSGALAPPRLAPVRTRDPPRGGSPTGALRPMAMGGLPAMGGLWSGAMGAMDHIARWADRCLSVYGLSVYGLSVYGLSVYGLWTAIARWAARRPAPCGGRPPGARDRRRPRAIAPSRAPPFM